MRIYEVLIDITCGEYGFLDRQLFVCKNMKETEKKAEEHISEENSLYPGETYYKLSSIQEFSLVDGYDVDYKLRRIWQKNECKF